jgi:hypothetical protein
MNTPMRPSDDELEALLSEDSELIRRYRALPDSEPGKHLDAAILGRAANAVRKPSLRPRWLIPVASAASVVAAAGIGWRVHQMQQQEDARVPAPAGRYEVLEIDLQAGDRERALDMAKMPPQPAAKPQEQPEAKARPSLSEIISGPARDNGVVVEQRARAPGFDELHTRTDHAEGGRTPERPGVAAQLGAAANADRAAAAPAPAPPPAMVDEEYRELQKREATEPPGLGLRDRRQRAQAADAYEREESRGVADPDDDIAVLSPADWIERIRTLIRIRRIGQARDEIRAFREVYPSYRLPRDIARYER